MSLWNTPAFSLISYSAVLVLSSNDWLRTRPLDKTTKPQANSLTPCVTKPRINSY